MIDQGRATCNTQKHIICYWPSVQPFQKMSVTHLHSYDKMYYFRHLLKQTTEHK